MSQQTINIGSGELTGDGESLRSAFGKINDNFDELYAVSSVGDKIPAKNISGFELKNNDFTAESGVRYIIDTSSNIVNVTLPTSASVGDNVFFTDGSGNFAINNFTVLQSGYTIMGSASDLITNVNNESFGLVYNGTTWRLF